MIYFLLDEESAAIKIGFTTDSIYARIDSLQIGNPRRLLPLAECPGNFETEQRLHRRLEPFCIRGEWFDANHPDVQNIVLYHLNEAHNLDEKTDFWKAVFEARQRMAMRYLIDKVGWDGYILAVETP